MPTTTGGAGDTRDKTILTHRGVEALRPDVTAYRIPDLRCPGLAVRVAPSGLKTWDVSYRIRGAGRGRRLSLGPFPAISLEEARERTSALTKAAKAGRDVVAEEKTIKAVAEARTTVSELIERYLNRMVRGRLRTAFEIENRLKKILAPLKDRYADDIRRGDLRAILNKPADRGVMREAEKQRQLMRVLPAGRWVRTSSKRIRQPELHPSDRAHGVTGSCRSTRLSCCGIGLKRLKHLLTMLTHSSYSSQLEPASASWSDCALRRSIKKPGFGLCPPFVPKMVARA